MPASPRTPTPRCVSGHENDLPSSWRKNTRFRNVFRDTRDDAETRVVERARPRFHRARKRPRQSKTRFSRPLAAGDSFGSIRSVERANAPAELGGRRTRRTSRGDARDLEPRHPRLTVSSMYFFLPAAPHLRTRRCGKRVSDVRSLSPRSRARPPPRPAW